MNNSNILFALAFALLFLFACGGSTENANQEPPAAEIEESATSYEVEVGSLSTLADHYFALKNALVASRADTAQAIAQHWAETGEAEAAWKTVAENSDLEAQRKAFEAITEAAYVKLKEAPDGKVYVQYCPMAFEGKGAKWLSQEEAVRNPYFGDEMLKCGSVEEVLGKR